MKVVILSSYPLVDNHRYKKIFVDGLAAFGGEITEAILVYGNTRPRDYYREAMGTFGLRDSLRKFRRNSGGAAPAKSDGAARAPEPNDRRKLDEVARSHGFAVRTFGALKDADCVAFLRSVAPDVIHNLSGSYIPRSILDIPPHGVISGHYGLLPDIRGGDTVRWSVLLGVPLAVSHMVLAPAMDMGDIVNVEYVLAGRGDTIADLRRRCQLVNGRVHLELLRKLIDGRLERIPQIKSQGTYFYRMGRVLKEKVDAILVSNQYGGHAE